MEVLTQLSLAQITATRLRILVWGMDREQFNLLQYPIQILALYSMQNIHCISFFMALSIVMILISWISHVDINRPYYLKKKP